MLGSSGTEPFLGIGIIVAAKLVPAEQQRIGGKPLRPGEFFEAGDIIGRDGEIRIVIALGHEASGEVVANRIEFLAAVGSRPLQREQRLHRLVGKQRRGLLDRRLPLGRIGAVLQDISVGVLAALRPLRLDEGFGDAPEDIDLAAGEQARCCSSDIDHSRMLLEVRSIDEAGAGLGDVKPVEQIGRRLPSGIGCLAVGDGLAQLRIAAIRIELPHGLELLVAILRHGERIGRRDPVRIERLKAGDLGLQAHLVAAAGEITKRTFIDGRLRRRGRLLRSRRRGNDWGCHWCRLGDGLSRRSSRLRCRRLRCCRLRFSGIRIGRVRW